MTAPVISPATTAKGIADVVALCWAYRDALAALSPTDAHLMETFYPPEKYRAVMADLPKLHARPTGVILLARAADGTPLGCGMTQPLSAEHVEMKRLYVSPAARGQGVARALCTALMDQARADGYTVMQLDTSKSLTAAQSLYAQLGFAKRSPYQPVPEAAAKHMLFYERSL